MNALAISSGALTTAEIDCAMAYAEAEKAPATREANASDRREFARWCAAARARVPPRPPSGARGHRKNTRRTVNRFIVDGLSVRHSSPKTPKTPARREPSGRLTMTTSPFAPPAVGSRTGGLIPRRPALRHRYRRRVARVGRSARPVQAICHDRAGPAAPRRAPPCRPAPRAVMTGTPSAAGEASRRPARQAFRTGLQEPPRRYAN